MFVFFNLRLKDNFEKLVVSIPLLTSKDSVLAFYSRMYKGSHQKEYDI